jgi:hypothetical protein
MVFILEDSVHQAQNLGPPESPSRCKSGTTKALALVWASKAAKRDFCGSGLRSTTNEEVSGMLSLFLQRFTFFLSDRTLISRKLYAKCSLRVAFHHNLGEINYISLIHPLPRVGDNPHNFGPADNIM